MRKRAYSLIAICLAGSLFCSCVHTTVESSKKAEETINATDPINTDNSVENLLPLESVIDEARDESSAEEPDNAVIIASNYSIVRDVYGLTREERLSSKHTFKYSDFVIDKYGNIVSARVSGNNSHVMHYEYDDNNRLVKSIKEDPLYGSEHIWIYDDQGRLIKSTLVEKGEEKVDTYEYDENGDFVSGQRTSASGNIFYNSYECDENGHITKRVEIRDGEVNYTYTYFYEGDMINPTSRVEESRRSHYDIDVFYDDRGRAIKENVVDKDGKKTINEFVYEIVGEVTESPESNPVLVKGDLWTFFDENPNVPIPSSCISTIKASNDENKVFILPTYKGTFTSVFGEPDFEETVVDSSFAFTAIDQYTNILSDVLDFEVKNMGTIIKVLKDGEAVMTLYVETIDGNYVLRVAF